MNLPDSPADRQQCRTLLRAQMPICPEVAYFDHAAVGPLSGPAIQQMRQYIADFGQKGDLVWPQYSKLVETARRSAALGLNAELSELAWISNTTQGIGLVAEGLDWRTGDNLVTLANEFPSNLYPWINLASRGVETRQAAVDPTGRWTVDEILRKCDAKTRLISVSWVGFATGFRGPVEALVDAAHQQGILVFLDAIQGLGVFPLDVKNCRVDFLAADGHKWMLGPEGAGLLYVAQNALNQLRPMNVGWNSVVDRYNFQEIKFNLRESASRYEGGTQNVVGVTALGASLQMLVDHGWGPTQSRIGETVLENAQHLAHQLQAMGATIHSPIDVESGSGIVSFTPPTGDPPALRDRCAERNVVLSCRNGRLRAAPHAYTNDDDIQRLVEALKPVR